ncbi:HTH-type transcriptional regulator MalT [Pseudomonas fluorescens]|uniref:HTH-type transcriptional regulator MalT n=2 Tax=Pseudomonas fluorescens TaxID=294 RepID=A0A5E7HSA0_PSEFL|nr:HTH-type transcriptional regulator MalT [Pseudomonas fluorescens]
MACGAFTGAKVTRLHASDLRFRLEETLAILNSALGSQSQLDTGVTLHEVTEGWPMGVQLAVSNLYRNGDLQGLISSVTGDVRRYFVDSVIASQPVDIVHLLVRIADLELIHPDLCVTLLGREDIKPALKELQNNTPLFTHSEGSEWMRLHALARDILSERLAMLPRSERVLLSKRASSWYASQGLYEDAAQQSFLAGDVEDAIALISNNTYEMTIHGKSNAVLSWYNRLPNKQLEEHAAFWGPVGWALAMSDRNAQAEQFVSKILDQEGITETERFEAHLIQLTAAAFADQIDRVESTLDEWPTPPDTARPGNLPIYFISRAFVELYKGNPDKARQELALIADLSELDVYSPVSFGLRDYALGTSYLWEGRNAIAAQTLQPALIKAEMKLGRHNPVTCMLATSLATALWGSGQNDEPCALLAGRLPVLVKYGLPDSILQAFTTLASIADESGRQDKALDLLEELNTLGETRSNPRMQIAALVELTRLHARRDRKETAFNSTQRLKAEITKSMVQIPAAHKKWADLMMLVADSYAATLQEKNHITQEGVTVTEKQESFATELKRGIELIESRLLRSEILRKSGNDESRAIWSETLSLAQAMGIHRMEQIGLKHKTQNTTQPSNQHPVAPQTTAASSSKVSPLLTSKELEVLNFLSKSMSNKEIARAMDIGEETIKWHMKNLVSKLNAAGRKHAIVRAKQLGIIQDG